MATLISEPMRWMADQVVHQCGYRSAVLSGLSPDSGHLARGGFHCSIDDLYAHGNGADYSNTRPNDHGYNPHYGAAMDVSFAKADMVLAFARVHEVWADHADPRRLYVNAINGWDGGGDATRLDFDAGTAKYASPDHRWHAHAEVHRRFVLDPKATRAVVSIFKGESRQAWTAREESGFAPKPRPSTGVIMVEVSGTLPVLKRGMKDPIAGWNYIDRLQRLRGLKADGDFGPATEKDIVAFNLKALNRNSKIVDAALWKVLYGIQPS